MNLATRRGDGRSLLLMYSTKSACAFLRVSRTEPEMGPAGISGGKGGSRVKRRV